MVSVALMAVCLVMPTLPAFVTEMFSVVPSFNDYVIQSADTNVSFVESPPSRATCLSACARDVRCASVFFNSQDGRCQLQEGRFFQPQGGTVQAGWQYWVLATSEYLFSCNLL